MSTLRATFQTPHSEFAEHNGKPFTVICKVPMSKESGPGYKIILEDNTKLIAWPEEIYETKETGTVGDPIRVV